MSKKFSSLFLVVLITLTAIPMPGTAQVSKSTMCPVMVGEHAKEKFFVDYQGKRIHLCCRNCVKAFKKSPEKYLQKIND